MAILGNLLLFIAALVMIGFNSIVYKAPPKGDGAIGYFWSLIILGGVFLLLMALASIIIGVKGGFDWIGATTGLRFFIVAAGLCCAVGAMALSGLFKYENGPVSPLLKMMVGFAPLLMPAVLVVVGCMLLNKNIRVSVPVNVYKIPLLIVVATGAVACIAAAIDWMKEVNRNNIASVHEVIEQNNANQQRMLNEIDSCDVMTNMVFILVFTDANQDEIVREKAIAKVKTNPQWQEELVRRLKTDWAPESFNFLASNEVDDKSLFPEAINEGVLIQAKLIRESIRRSSHPSHFYPSQFLWETERVIRTAHDFKNNVVDFLPAIKELRSALDEPSEFDKPVFICQSVLDNWIAEHSN